MQQIFPERAVFYGDTLFETIRVSNGTARLLDWHIERLLAGLRLLGMQPSEHWSTDFFRQEIAAKTSGNARVRLTVWREAGGLYLPESTSSAFSLHVYPLSGAAFSWPEHGLKVGISEKVRLPMDTFSNLKTLNAPRYVQAAIEARSAGWNDAIILNSDGRICEATSSNIFWWQSGTEKPSLCTVPLGEGCVAGVMRRFVLETARTQGIAVSEAAITQEQLLTQDEIFLTNAIRGVVPVGAVNEKRLRMENTQSLFEVISDRYNLFT